MKGEGGEGINGEGGGMKGVAWVTDERPAGPGRRGFDPGNVRGYGGPVREAPSPYPLPPTGERENGEVLSPKGKGEEGGSPHLASPPGGGEGLRHLPLPPVGGEE